MARGLSRPQLFQSTRALLLPFLLRDPHVFLVGHDIRQHGAAEENHVSPPWGVFDADFEFLCVKLISTVRISPSARILVKI